MKVSFIEIFKDNPLKFAHISILNGMCVEIVENKSNPDFEVLSDKVILISNDQELRRYYQNIIFLSLFTKDNERYKSEGFFIQKKSIIRFTTDSDIENQPSTPSPNLELQRLEWENVNITQDFLETKLNYLLDL